MKFLLKFALIYLINASKRTVKHQRTGGLIFKETCKGERCSGSVKCPDSEKDEVTWKRCTKLKMDAIQEISPDVIFNFNLPSCIPSGYQVVSMSGRCG